MYSFSFKLHRLVLAGYSIIYLEDQRFEVILEEISQEIELEKDEALKKNCVKILLQPGVSIGTVSVARMSKSSALDIIAAMKKLASLQLGKFVEVSNLLGECAYLKLRVFPISVLPIPIFEPMHMHLI
jgi:hypothetical protein